ncbi:MAG TPA: M48 family metallopeptidase [Candidatus Nanoarchaeia archaeon]|nr:M48 family metallopeptidase [Candidatus Nanoarchaeia archaeon]
MQHIDFRDQISGNKWRSSFLMLIVITFIVVLGYVISMAFDPGYFFVIMIFAIIFSMIYVVIGYYNSHKIAVASVGAKPASREKHKMFFDLVEGLTLASGLPMPKLYVMPSNQINAFASGRDPKHAVICVTEGALNKLDRRKLEGVLAHELGHVGNYDIRFITLVAVLVGMVAIISQIFLRSLFFSHGGGNKKNVIFIIIGIALAIIAPIAVYLVQMSISRKREYSADATAVKFTRYPEGLIKALEKIKNEHAPTEKKINKAVAPLFFANPFKNLGSTHPPIEKRIEVLKRM